MISTIQTVGEVLKIVYTHGTDGLTDSVKLHLMTYTYYDKEMLKLLLTPFLWMMICMSALLLGGITTINKIISLY